MPPSGLFSQSIGIKKIYLKIWQIFWAVSDLKNLRFPIKLVGIKNNQLNIFQKIIKE